jgi:hypothetical protein
MALQEIGGMSLPQDMDYFTRFRKSFDEGGDTSLSIQYAMTFLSRYPVDVCMAMGWHLSPREQQKWINMAEDEENLVNLYVNEAVVFCLSLIY